VFKVDTRSKVHPPMREVGISRASSGLNTIMVLCEALEEVADSNNILIFTEVADSNIETICRS
jgi:hypothetical protein